RPRRQSRATIGPGWPSGTTRTSRRIRAGSEADVASPGGSRRPRRAAIRALVLTCARVDGQKADVWAGRKRLVLRLSCGHDVIKVDRRRWLVGERVRCRFCEAKALQQATLFPMADQEA